MSELRTSVQDEIDKYKPLFDYTRNLLSLLAFWSIVAVSWTLATKIAVDDPLLYYVMYASLAVAVVFGICLGVSFVRLSERIIDAVGRHLRQSGSRLARGLSLPLVAGSAFIGIVLNVMIWLSVAPPVLGIIRALSNAAAP